MLKVLVKDIASSLPICDADPKSKAYSQIKDIFSEPITSLIKQCCKSEMSSIITTFDCIDSKVINIIKPSLDSWSLRQSSDSFRLMMLEFCNHYDTLMAIELRKMKNEILRIQSNFRRFFAIKNEEDKVEELMEFLVQFDAKHKEKVEKLARVR